ncbi:SUR7/PalI family-domain-containing protein [Lipomyces oligophaga]|uniref:SUR7/PalI family-domain-containing protein n=1 Tax=Lipomyces oligophaga TaxID=45792 RepID=UPI0034CF1384
MSLRGVAPVCLLLAIAFGLQLVSVISVPVIDSIVLANYEGVKFGVFGYCTSSNCSTVRIGYPESIVSDDSADFSLPSNARHSLTNLLIVHPIAAGFTLILLILTLLVAFSGPAHSPRYILFLLVLCLPTFILSLLAFLVDILLFVPHLAWGGWIVLGATVIIAVCSLVFCTMRRTLASREAMRDRAFQQAQDEADGAMRLNQLPFFPPTSAQNQNSSFTSATKRDENADSVGLMDSNESKSIISLSEEESLTRGESHSSSSQIGRAISDYDDLSVAREVGRPYNDKPLQMQQSQSNQSMNNYGYQNTRQPPPRMQYGPPPMNRRGPAADGAYDRRMGPGPGPYGYPRNRLPRTGPMTGASPGGMGSAGMGGRLPPYPSAANMPNFYEMPDSGMGAGLGLGSAAMSSTVAAVPTAQAVGAGDGTEADDIIDGYRTSVQPGQAGNDGRVTSGEIPTAGTAVAPRFGNVAHERVGDAVMSVDSQDGEAERTRSPVGMGANGEEDYISPRSGWAAAGVSPRNGPATHSRRQSGEYYDDVDIQYSQDFSPVQAGTGPSLRTYGLGTNSGGPRSAPAYGGRPQRVAMPTGNEYYEQPGMYSEDQGYYYRSGQGRSPGGPGTAPVSPYGGVGSNSHGEPASRNRVDKTEVMLGSNPDFSIPGIGSGGRRGPRGNMTARAMTTATTMSKDSPYAPASQK